MSFGSWIEAQHETVVGLGCFIARIGLASIGMVCKALSMGALIVENSFANPMLYAAPYLSADRKMACLAVTGAARCTIAVRSFNSSDRETTWRQNWTIGYAAKIDCYCWNPISLLHRHPFPENFLQMGPCDGHQDD
jgi:hypothetical protein